MIALNDESMSMLLQLAGPIHPAERSQFLRDVAEQLRGHAEIGDGLIGRVAREVQARYLKGLHVSGVAAHGAS
jgi:hypothetical protein